MWTRDVEDAKALASMPPEYTEAVSKLIVSLTVNHLVGARVYDEPSIQLAPNPVEKWLACRLAMEEYGHHVRFARLAAEIGIDEARLDPSKNKHLNVFDVELNTWAEFVVLKTIVDLAEVIQVEDLLRCTYVPLRTLTEQVIYREELFHVQFGWERAKELVKTESGRKEVQEVIRRFYPHVLPYFGGSKSKNNELYRRWGIKVRTNDEMRIDYIRRVRRLVEEELNLEMPPLPPEYKYLETLLS